MMLTADYVRLMARYNAWQNAELTDALDGTRLVLLKADHGAAFSSILGTLNHILWADQLWLSRLDPDIEAPAGDLSQSAGQHPAFGAWSAARFSLDAQISRWAAALHNVDLQGDLQWSPTSDGPPIIRPLAPCVVQMFNQQTHHRGQVHAMMTRLNLTPPVSDLVLMPELLP